MTDDLPDPPDPITFCDLPVRLDTTLVAPGEVWLESSTTGEVVRVWPPADVLADEG